MHYNISMKYVKEHPECLYKGCIIKEITLNEHIYYEVMEAKPFPILKELERIKIPNAVGDYMLNMRTGYISYYGENDTIIPTETKVEPEGLRFLEKFWETMEKIKCEK